jgi:hypothetical protein
MLAGSLAEFDVPTLLQTVCIGRQSTLLDILDADGRALGSVHVKGAKVVSATAGTLRGFDAIRILINAPGTWQFVVSRSPTPVDDVEPIGSVAEVLFEAPDVERRPENLATVNGTAVDAPRELGPAKKRESQRAVMAATSGDRKSRRRRRALVAAPVAVAIAASALLAVFGPSSTPRPAPVAPEVHAGLAPSPPVPAPSDSSPAPAAPPTSAATPTPVPAAPLPEPPVAAAHHDRAPLATVEDVQIALTSLGYAPGPIDNKRGPLTRRAIRAFQRDAGLRVTGRPDAPTLDAIGERLAPSVD